MEFCFPNFGRFAGGSFPSNFRLPNFGFFFPKIGLVGTLIDLLKGFGATTHSSIGTTGNVFDRLTAGRFPNLLICVEPEK